MLVAKAELNYYPEYAYEEEYQKRKNTKQTPKKAPKKNNKYNLLIKLICLLIAIIILSISLFILFRYASITKVRMEVTELERQKVELEKYKLNLIADLEGVKSSLSISQDAMNKLGMSYPKEGQVMYVSLAEPAVEVNESIGVAEKLNNVLSMFSGLF